MRQSLHSERFPRPLLPCHNNDHYHHCAKRGLSYRYINPGTPRLLWSNFTLICRPWPLPCTTLSSAVAGDRSRGSEENGEVSKSNAPTSAFRLRLARWKPCLSGKIWFGAFVRWNCAGLSETGFVVVVSKGHATTLLFARCNLHVLACTLSFTHRCVWSFVNLPLLCPASKHQLCQRPTTSDYVGKW